jgi:hypothetical protein
MGGLGNQMFQYAAGLSVARRNGFPLRIDTTRLKAENPHQGYQLDTIFAGEFLEASNWELLNLLKFQIFFKRKAKIFRNWTYAPPVAIIRQCTHNYWSNFDMINHPCYLSGYWQSPKYFENVQGEIRKSFTFKEPLDSANRRLLCFIEKENSVCIHLRRGDYVSDARANRFHGVCEWSYYDRAMEMISKQVKDAYFFVFSDEPHVARQRFERQKHVHIVDLNRGEHSYRDLRLMQGCKHHIISNSSFSWWGAWLAKGKQQIVIAPSVWFAGSHEPITDIYDPTWIRI